MDLSSLEKLCDKVEGERDSAFELAQSTERTVYVEEKTNASWSWGLGSFAGVATGFKLFSYFMDAYSNGTLNPVLSTAQNMFPFTLPIATVAGGCAAMVAVSAGMQIALRNTYENAKKEFHKKDDRRLDIKRIYTYAVNNKVKEYLSDKELEKFKNDKDRYFVIDLSGRSIYDMNNIKTETNAPMLNSLKERKYVLDIASTLEDNTYRSDFSLFNKYAYKEAFDDIPRASLIVQSDYIGINENVIVIDKQSAKLDVVCSTGIGDVNSCKVVGYDLSSYNEKEANKIFDDSLQSVENFKKHPSAIFHEACKENNLGVDIKIPPEYLVYTSLGNHNVYDNAKFRNDKSLYLYLGGEENHRISLRDNINSIEKTEDKGYVLHLGNPLTVQKDKEFIGRWMSYCENKNLSNYECFNMNEYNQFNQELHKQFIDLPRLEYIQATKEKKSLDLNFGNGRFSVKIPLQEVVKKEWNPDIGVYNFMGVVKKDDFPLKVESELFNEPLLIKDMKSLKKIVNYDKFSLLENVPVLEASIPKSNVSFIEDNDKKVMVFNNIRDKNSGIHVEDVKEISDGNGGGFYRIKYKPLQSVTFNTMEKNQKVFHTMRIYENKNLDFLVKKNLEEGQKNKVQVIKNERVNIER